MTTVDQIADAILYEGYILYPYRPSALKNRQRWNFGLLYPQNYQGTVDGSSPGVMRTECLVVGSDSTRLQIRVRFLHVVTRQIAEALANGGTRPVDSLRLGGDLHQSWQEALQRQVAVPCMLRDLVEVQSTPFAFEASSTSEPLRDAAGVVAGFIERAHARLQGVVSASAREILKGVYRLTVQVENTTLTERPDCREHDRVALETFVSTHTILEADGGEFVSSLDPPESLQSEVGACRNLNTWPVLAGDRNSAPTTMLSSPIILYDYPEIAQGSPGDLFDGTEIDEILTLRILTMTDEEKHEMRHADARARRILERTESLSAEHFARLHGTVRPTEERSAL